MDPVAVLEEVQGQVQGGRAWALHQVAEQEAKMREMEAARARALGDMSVAQEGVEQALAEVQAAEQRWAQRQAQVVGESEAEAARRELESRPDREAHQASLEAQQAAWSQMSAAAARAAQEAAEADATAAALQQDVAHWEQEGETLRKAAQAARKEHGAQRARIEREVQEAMVGVAEAEQEAEAKAEARRQSLGVLEVRLRGLHTEAANKAKSWPEWLGGGSQSTKDEILELKQQCMVRRRRCKLDPVCLKAPLVSNAPGFKIF